VKNQSIVIVGGACGGLMKKQRVFLDDGKVIGLDGARRFCVDLDTIETILLAWTGNPYEWPEQFSVLLMADTFFLIGPEVENCLGIVLLIKQERAEIPMREVDFPWAIRWRLRHRGSFGLRLFPTPGFGIFPLDYLPEYTMIEREKHA